METAFSIPAILSIVFNILVGIGLPILLVVLIKNKYKMRIGVLFVGACAYIAANMFLQGIVDTCVYLIKPLADFFLNNPMPRAVFFAILHGGVQLGGYYLIIHMFMKDFKRKENALMFGVGVRIIDSVIAYGIGSGLSMLMLAVNVNSQGFEAYLAGFGTEHMEENREMLLGMVQMPVSEILSNGLIGLFLMIMTMAVSVLIFLAAKRKDKMHLLPTAGAILVINSLLMELYSADVIKELLVCVALLGVLAVLSGVLSFFVYRADTEEERGRADIITDKAIVREEKQEISMKERMAHVSKVNSGKTSEE